MSARRTRIVFILALLTSSGAGLASECLPTDNEWPTISPENAGWSEAELEHALGVVESLESSGVVIVKRGRLLAERCRLLGDVSQRESRFMLGATAEGYPLEDVASVQKSVVATLTAMAPEKGLLDYEDPVSLSLGEDWELIITRTGANPPEDFRTWWQELAGLIND